MNNKSQISLDTIKWISSEMTNIEFVIESLKKYNCAEDFDGVSYDVDDLFFLEKRLEELKKRSKFEETNLKKIQNGF